MMRFLIDECLSPQLAEAARARGFDATHVLWLGRASTADWTLAALAVERDYVIVTNNARDFRRIYRRIEMHPGLVVIIPELDGPRQGIYFLQILDFIGRQDDLINQLVEIDRDGHISIKPWSDAGR